jgi:hypothetical protein
MSAPVFLRGNYSDLFGADMLPVLEELFRAEMSLHPSRRQEVFKIVSTDRDIWQATELHDMPLYSEVPEGSDYSFERPRQGASKTLKPVKFGLGFSISEEAVDDGKFDYIADAVRKMARSGIESQEIQAMNIFNNGFSSETSSDGLSVFNSAHTLPSGLTYRNVLSVPADLSSSSLEQMLQDFETQFVGDTGIIYNIKPKVLLVHSNNKRLAKELIGSDLKPDVATLGTDGITNINNMNSFREEGLRVVSSPHLTDADAWFMLADPMETGLRIVSRKPIETKAGGSDVGFLSDAILYKSRYREKIGVTHAYGIMGTAGA